MCGMQASIERQQGQTGSVLETALALLTGRQDAKTDATVAATAAAKPADTSAGSSDTPSEYGMSNTAS